MACSLSVSGKYQHASLPINRLIDRCCEVKLQPKRHEESRDTKRAMKAMLHNGTFRRRRHVTCSWRQSLFGSTFLSEGLKSPNLGEHQEWISNRIPHPAKIVWRLWQKIRHRGASSSRLPQHHGLRSNLTQQPTQSIPPKCPEVSQSATSM